MSCWKNQFILYIRQLSDGRLPWPNSRGVLGFFYQKSIVLRVYYQTGILFKLFTKRVEIVTAIDDLPLLSYFFSSSSSFSTFGKC
jgi:hypothetical protein